MIVAYSSPSHYINHYWYVNYKTTVESDEQNDKVGRKIHIVAQPVLPSANLEWHSCNCNQTSTLQGDCKYQLAERTEQGYWIITQITIAIQSFSNLCICHWAMINPVNAGIPHLSRSLQRFSVMKIQIYDVRNSFSRQTFLIRYLRQKYFTSYHIGS